MANISEFVTVNLVTGTAPLQAPSYSLPLVAAYLTPAEVAATGMNNRVASFTSLQGVLSSGLTANSAAYRAIAPFFSQSLCVPTVMLGRLANPPDLTIKVYPTGVAGRVFSLNVVGTNGIAKTVTFTSTTAVVADIVAGLLAAFNTQAPAGLVGTNGTTHLQVKASTAGLHFSVAPLALSASVVSCQQDHADPGLAADLAAIADENNSWYTLSLATAGKAELAVASAYALANKKLGFFSTQDGDILAATAGNVALTLAATANDRAGLVFGGAASAEQPAQALLGQVLPLQPGATWTKFKRPAGVTADMLSGTSVTNLKASNVHFINGNGVSFYESGKLASGEYFDNRRNLDWFKSDMEVELANAFLANPIIHYDDVGLTVMESCLTASAKRAESRGVIRPGWRVSVPTLASISAADLAARVLNDCKVVCSLSGAIGSVVVNATVTF